MQPSGRRPRHVAPALHARRSRVRLAVAAGLAALGLLVAGPALAAPAAACPVPGPGGAPGSWEHGHHSSGVVALGGSVASPARYTVAQLAAAGTVTVPSGRPGSTLTGVSLDHLVTVAGPVLPSAKNALLAVTVTVTSTSGRAVTFALGELDPSFGNHDALLVTAHDGRPVGRPDLVVPGDLGSSRSIRDVAAVTVAVHTPQPVPTPAAGSLVVVAGARTVTLDAATLARLPRTTRTVTFASGSGQQTHTETGPSLAAVLRAAHLWVGATTWVAGVGSDGYVAVVTPGESSAGGRPLMVSLVEDGAALSQPRLVAVGDVKGGRDVSGIVELVVGS